MKYLLDTDMCIFFFQGKLNIKNKIEEVGLGNCYISEITIAELKYGAEDDVYFRPTDSALGGGRRLDHLAPGYPFSLIR